MRTSQKLEKAIKRMRKYPKLSRILINITGTVLIILLLSHAVFPSPEEVVRAGSSGFNTELPPARGGRISDDKGEEYRKEDERMKEIRKMKSAADFFALLDAQDKHSRSQTDNVQNEDGISASANSSDKAQRGSACTSIEASRQAHHHLNRMMGETGKPDAADMEKEALKRQVEQLQAQVNALSSANAAAGTDRQLELMEESFRMASRYFPANGTAAGTTATDPRASDDDGKAAEYRRTQTVKPYSPEEVSCMGSAANSREQGTGTPKRNRFYTVTDKKHELQKARNSIRAVFNEDITLTAENRPRLRLRLSEAMQVGQTVIPEGHLLYGTATLKDGRLEVNISSLEYEGNIMPAALEVYDLDGQKGIHVPSREGNRAAAEIMSGMAGDAGTGVRIGGDAVGELGAQVGRGIINGTSRYAAGKLRKIKIHIREGYQVLLLPAANGCSSPTVRGFN